MRSLLFVFTLISFLSPAFSDVQVQVTSLNVSEPTAPDQRVVDRYSYYFGRVWVNSTHYAAYRLTNTGTTPLTFSRATISGINFDGFHNCKNGLIPGQSCQFEIRYSPFFEGYDSGRFIISFIENLDIVVDVWGEAYRP